MSEHLTQFRVPGYGFDCLRELLGVRVRPEPHRAHVRLAERGKPPGDQNGSIGLRVVNHSPECRAVPSVLLQQSEVGHSQPLPGQLLADTRQSHHAISRSNGGILLGLIRFDLDDRWFAHQWAPFFAPPPRGGWDDVRPEASGVSGGEAF
jgi:hypothetical protein